MIRFEHTVYLYFLGALIIPFLAFIFYWKWRETSIKKWGQLNLLKQVTSGYSKSLPISRLLIMLIALALIVIGFANPQWGGKSRNVHHEGIDIALAIDVSNSMLATDVSPSRIEAAKKVASALNEKFADSRFAVVSFAGSASTLLPLTPDHAAVEMTLQNLSTSSAAKQGTDLSSALTESMRALPENLNHHRAIVLITDGEDHEGKVEEVILDAAHQGFVVCTVGLGDESGSNIPVGTGIKRAPDGSPVVTKQDVALLKIISGKSSGVYASLQDLNSLDLIAQRLTAVGTNQLDETIYTQYESRFQYFLISALLLLIIELLILNKKVKVHTGKLQMRMAYSVIAFVVIDQVSFLPGSSTALIEKGITAYDQRKFQEATTDFLSAIKNDKEKKYPEAYFNLANVYFQQGKFVEAINNYKSAIAGSKDRTLQSKAFFNIGTSYLSQKKYEESIVAFERSLMLNPKNEDARYNLSYVDALLAGSGRNKGMSSATEQIESSKRQPRITLPPLSKEEEQDLKNKLSQSELQAMKNNLSKKDQGALKKDW